MRTIADLDEIEFLKQTNKIRKAVMEPLSNLNIMSILKSQTIDMSKMTDAQKILARRKQMKNNIDKALDVMLEEKPEETIKLLKLLIILDEGETLSGAKIMSSALKILSDRDVIDFLSSLTA